MDLFKAIFAESSSEDDSSSDVEENKEESAGSKTEGNISSDMPRKWQDLSVITNTTLPATAEKPAPSSGHNNSQRRENKDRYSILPTPAQRENINATLDGDKRDHDIHEKGSEQQQHHHSSRHSDRSTHYQHGNNSHYHSNKDTHHQHSSNSHYHGNKDTHHQHDSSSHYHSSNALRNAGRNTDRHSDSTHGRRRDHETQRRDQHQRMGERNTADISGREEAPSAPPVSDAPTQQVSYGPALPLGKSAYYGGGMTSE